MSDAKLSTKKRKSLPGSSFCGPGRSFPVPDCAHVTAALRLLNRAKVSSSTKAKIRACVMRKSRSMNCKTTQKKKDSKILTAEEQEALEAENLILSDSFADTREFVEWLEGDYMSRDDDLTERDSLKESAAKLLATLRSERKGEDDEYEKYMVRSISSILDSLLDEFDARGQGQGQGGPRQGNGGASKCVCPKCGATIAHNKGTPCNETKCPKCGTPMTGSQN